MSEPQIPKRVAKKHGSERKFKEAKRRQLTGVVKAMEELRCGCSFMPGYHLFVESDHNLRKLQKLLSQREWGR